ncbi:SDR family oxidoreductase [Rhodococcus sp. IEGM 1307]|uniref:SDR family oxidoreductase n=1 Tax=Rhodococcus sp. IEGM 1307 TaxID=3047091 RepID=UPI0024B66997|nr:SDR family oxidoreductase [Rhodococcus sp. IEGM 1307]MDI9979407.1 SDR family oxidoreductase [Rhodococcus sp. IEGM 1307]
MNELADKTVLITGGASGIGLGMVQAFLEEGSKVVVADINAVNFSDARQVLADDLSRVEFVELDVSEDESWIKVIDHVWETYGGIDVLVNNAGVGQGVLPSGKQARAWELSASARDIVLDVNIAGVIRGVQHVVPRMIERGQGGHLISTASMAGLVAVPGTSLYDTSKFAIVGFSEALAGELIPHNIGVSILCPGSVKSKLKATAAQRSAANTSDGISNYLETLQEARSGKMDALAVGRRTVTAVKNNELYVITHPAFKQEVELRHRKVEAAFGEPAQAGYVENPAAVAAASNPIYLPDDSPETEETPPVEVKQKALIVTQGDIDPGHEDEFNLWFDTEHVPERANCPGFLSARRFQAVEGGPKYLAIYEVENLDVLDTDDYRTMKTPSEWQRKIAPHLTQSSRRVYTEITRPVAEQQRVIAVRHDS